MDYPSRNIRFTTTEDGVDIAFWEIGEGKPVVILNSFGLSHAEFEWEVPSIASFYSAMAERYRVIRFDPRGWGLSGDPPGGWGSATESGAQQGMSTREMGLDVEAVAAALELDSFALLAVSLLGPVAIAYAAIHPEVSELILCDAMSSNATGWLGPTLRTQIGLSKLEKEAGESVFSPWERVGPHDEAEYQGEDKAWVRRSAAVTSSAHFRRVSATTYRSGFDSCLGLGDGRGRSLASTDTARTSGSPHKPSAGSR